MKVCQLCAVDFTVKHFLLPIVDGMQSRNWQVTVVCSEGAYTAALKEQGYRIQSINIARSVNPFKALWSLFNLVVFLRRESFDVLHVHTPVAALIGRVAARLVGIPLVVYTAHGFYFHDQMPVWKRSIFVQLERWAGTMTDLILSVSKEDAEFAIGNGIGKPGTVLAVGNGVDAAVFDPERVSGNEVRASLSIPDHAFVVGMAGRLVREKGVVEFLQAAETLVGRGVEIWFMLVGERLQSDHDACVDRELDKARTKLGQRLCVLGFRSDMPQILASLDVFCLPSWREGMPLSIIEAMMMAKPVVATNIRGSREEVVNGETGLLVDTHASEQLADALQRLVENPDYARQLGVAGRQRALKLFQIDEVVASQLERIEQAARAKGLVH